MYTMFVVSGIAYCMVIFYQSKYEMYKNTINAESGEFDDISVARYSIFVKHLPTKMGVEDLQDLITKRMKILYPKGGFEKVRVVGDYNSLYQ